MTRPAVCTSHGLCSSDILSVCPSYFDNGNKIPVFSTPPETTGLGSAVLKGMLSRSADSRIPLTAFPHGKRPCRTKPPACMSVNTATSVPYTCYFATRPLTQDVYTCRYVSACLVKLLCKQVLVC